MATQPRHLHRLLAFLEPHHRPAVRLQVGHDEPHCGIRRTCGDPVTTGAANGWVRRKVSDIPRQQATTVDERLALALGLQRLTNVGENYSLRAPEGKNCNSELQLGTELQLGE